MKSVDAKGAVIDLGNDVEGYLRAAEISADRVEDATTRLAAGDEVEALITNIDRKNRSIQLSIRAKDAAEARDALDRLNADARLLRHDQPRRSPQGQARTEVILNEADPRGSKGSGPTVPRGTQKRLRHENAGSLFS